MATEPRNESQLRLFGTEMSPSRGTHFPQLRYMGSKHRLLPWIHSVLSQLKFDSALDAFSGSGCVAYLLKSMGKRVVANDFLNFAHQIALGAVENSHSRLSMDCLDEMVRFNPKRRRFIETTFKGIFFTPSDLRFLDSVWANIGELKNRHSRALVLSALIRSCLKRQPRGVFTVAGDPERYKDGRRDLRLSLKEHFIESIQIYNAVVFDNGKKNEATRADVFDLQEDAVDLVYMDPPYVPRADDNCYIKRYHFLEGLASYWSENGTEILDTTKVRKIPKRFTPFSYRRTSIDAFDRMFAKFRESTQLLSYSSNGFPDLHVLIALMKKYKHRVDVFERTHRYHFGTHANVAAERAHVREYLVVGS